MLKLSAAVDSNITAGEPAEAVETLISSDPIVTVSSVDEVAKVEACVEVMGDSAVDDKPKRVLEEFK